MMTPEKKSIVGHVFSERLNSLAISIEEKKQREKKLNRLINDAFNSMTTSTETQALQNQLE